MMHSAIRRDCNQFLATHFLRQRGQSSEEPSSVHLRMQWRWKWWRHCPWMGTQSSPGTLQRGQGDSKANWQIVQHSSVSMSHFHVATAFQEFIFTFIQFQIIAFSEPSIGCKEKWPLTPYSTWGNLGDLRVISDIRMSHSRQKWLGGRPTLLKLLWRRCSLPSWFGFEYCQKEAFCWAVVECAFVSVFWFSRLPNIFVLKNPASLFIAPTGFMLSIDSFSFKSLLDSVLTRSPRVRLVGSLGSCIEQLAQSQNVMRLDVLLSLAKERLGLEQVLGQSWRESFRGRVAGVGASALPSRYLMMASFSAMALVRWQTLLLSSSCFISYRLRYR